MLVLHIEGTEHFDEESQTFETTGSTIVEMEHSLVSLSKWESEYSKPFLSDTPKTREEVYGYLRAMILTPGVGPDVLLGMSKKNIEDVQRYIDSSQSATTFGSMPERRGPGEVITSELIYYWLVSFNIPFECQYWHLNRLFSLIKICNIKNSKPKQLSRNEIAQRNRELNAKRKAQLGTSG